MAEKATYSPYAPPTGAPATPNPYGPSIDAPPPAPSPAYQTPPLAPTPGPDAGYVVQQQPHPQPQHQFSQSSQPQQHAQSAYGPQQDSYISQQPQATAAPRIIQNSKNLEVDAKGERAWNSGICGCFGDCGTCCVACWCPCITYGDVQSRLEYLEKHNSVHPEGGESCNGACWLHCALTSFLGAGWILQIMQRSNLRDRYRISGNLCYDCLAACCCNPCQLTQASREVEDEENALLGPGARGKA